MKLFNRIGNSVGGNILLFLFFFLIVLAVSFFSTAGILWLINWAFGLTFWSWKTSLGIWLAISLLSGMLTAHVKVER